MAGNTGLGSIAPRSLDETGCPSRPQLVAIDEATYLAVRRLASDQILITTDGVEPTGEVIRSLECELEAGAGSVFLDGLPDGEWLEVRLNPRHVGWPRPVPLGVPAVGPAVGEGY